MTFVNGLTNTNKGYDNNFFLVYGRWFSGGSSYLSNYGKPGLTLKY